MKQFIAYLPVGLALSACSSADQSLFIYRLPYAAGAEVGIWQDHTTHAGSEPAIDMARTDADLTYSIVAARAGIIRHIEDSNTQNCAPGDGCPNNYVWIQHTPGLEWTKYSHLATNSVTNAGWTEGATIAAGQFIGTESNIGQAAGSNMGRHLHFEVRLADASDTPSPTEGDLPGEMRIPRFCGVPGGIVEQSEEYTPSPCPN